MVMPDMSQVSAAQAMTVPDTDAQEGGPAQLKVREDVENIEIGGVK